MKSFKLVHFHSNMKHFILFTLIFYTCVGFSQTELLANQYFERGEFEKAKIAYEEVVTQNPSNSNYLQKLVVCYQQLSLFKEADEKLQAYLKKYKQPQMLVEIGYNFQLQKKETEAQNYYEQAFAKIEQNPSNAYSIAPAFERKTMLENALKAYQLGLAKDPNLNFNFQMAQIYGQMGELDEMIERYLDEVTARPQITTTIQNYLMRFMENALDDEFGNLLRKALLIRVQKTQDIYWNQFLSWFFVQQHQYDRAFVQEKAIFKRMPESLSNIINLAELAIEDEEEETAKEILSFILENTQNLDLQMTVHYYLLEMRIKKANQETNEMLEKDFELILKKYGISPYSLELQLLQAKFLAFNLNQSEKAKAILEQASELPLNDFQEASIKMLLGDILLYEEKFNQALLLYAQVDADMKNDEIGNEASFKIAQTTYFKADFEWALTQLKVLKSSDTQLIANDALELFLLINDQTFADSAQVALTKFAKADFYLFQNQTEKALSSFLKINEEHKEEAIGDVTLLRIGKCYEKLGNFEQALVFYQQLITDFPESIYSDEALFFSGNIYFKALNQPLEAQKLYEQIIFKHQDSIYFVEARKKYRQIRGDENL